MAAYYLAWWSILSNRCDGREGILSHPFTMTSAFMYPWQFFWDECYHSVLYGNLNDKEMPYAFLKNFIPVQFPNGGIPFSINSMSTEEYWKRVKSEDISGMCPPLIGFTMQMLKDKPGWPADIRPVYNFLSKNTEWRYANSDRDKDGLLGSTRNFFVYCC